MVGVVVLGEFVDVGFLVLGEVCYMMYFGEIVWYVVVGE